MPWNDDIQDASFRGVAFEVLETRDAISRRVIEHAYPYRNGADLEDTGREPRSTEMDIVFYGPDYLTELRAFFLVADEGETGRLIHPLLGTYQAKVLSVSTSHVAQRRDAAMVTAVFKEDGTDTNVPLFGGTEAEELTLKSEISLARSLATALDDAKKVTTALDTAASFVNSAADAIGDLANGLDSVLDTINEAIDEIEDAIENNALVQSVLRVGLACRRLKNSYERLSSRVSSFSLTTTMPLSTLALRLYGDAKRADDLRRINRVRNPFFVRGGGSLRVFDS